MIEKRSLTNEMPASNTFSFIFSPVNSAIILQNFDTL